MNRVFVIGAGLTKFLPSHSHPFDYTSLGQLALSRALRDSNLEYTSIDEAAVGYVYGDSCSGQRTLYEIGQTGIPIYNINNMACTGSTAIHIAYRSIKGGFSNCALALGFEKMKNNKKKRVFEDRINPLEPWEMRIEKLLGRKGDLKDIYENAGIEYMEKNGLKPLHLAKIACKNHLHSVDNPYALLRKPYTIEEIILSKRKNADSLLTEPQYAPSSDAGAAVILCSERFMLDHGLENQAVELLGMSLLTNLSEEFNSSSFLTLSGYNLAKKTADNLYKLTGIPIKSIKLCELDDITSIHELLTYEAIGLCEPDQISDFINKGGNTYGGQVVVNPSGGLLSKGFPIGASGIAQTAEICWNLRGMAGKRCVKSEYGLQFNSGFGGCSMILYKKYNAEKGFGKKGQTEDPDELERIEAEESKIFRRNNERERCPEPPKKKM